MRCVPHILLLAACLMASSPTWAEEPQRPIARMALEQGRDVLAVPGSVDSMLYQGSHRLIQEGAGLVCGPTDVLTALGLSRSVADKPSNATSEIDLNEKQRYLMSFLHDVMSVDELHLLTGWPVVEIVQELTALEVVGLVRNGGGADSADGYVASSRVL